METCNALDDNRDQKPGFSLIKIAFSHSRKSQKQSCLLRREKPGFSN